MWNRKNVSTVSRSRWAAIGAAVAVTLGAGGLVAVDAAGPESTFIAVEPARILDTRTDVGLSGSFASGVPRTVGVTGTVAVVDEDGDTEQRVAIPAGATSIVANLTIVAPTSEGFLSIRPGTATGEPQTSSLNFAAGDTVANSITVALPVGGAADGTVQIWYQGQFAAARANVLLDVTGYHVEGGTGPQGPAGDQGPAGADAVNPWEEIPSGETLAGNILYDLNVAAGGGDQDVVHVAFPAIAPVDLTDETVNIADDSISGDNWGDADPECTGTPTEPTAPAGKVCIYVSSDTNILDLATEGTSATLADRGFNLSVRVQGDTTGDDAFLYATWAYTAP